MAHNYAGKDVSTSYLDHKKYQKNGDMVEYQPTKCQPAECQPTECQFFECHPTECQLVRLG
jgi:hypothetical protein